MTTSADAKQSHDARLSTRGGDACPACMHPVGARIDLIDYELFACSSCGCWSSDALARGARTSFVPENYFSNARSDQDKWDDLWRRLGRPANRPASALDVGCGTGAYLAYLRGRMGDDARLEGIELDPERAAQSRGRDPRLRIHEGDAQSRLSDVASSFDLVTLWDVFEHVSAPGDLLRELAEVLAPDGVIYLQTIHEDSLLPRLGRATYRMSFGHIRYPARRTHEAHHLVFFSREGIDRMADAAGLRVREVWFDRLARSRMDGNAFLTAATSLVLGLENRLGNGLFINLILERKPHAN